MCALLLGFPCLASALLGFVWSFAVTRGLSSILVLGQGCGCRTRGCSPVRLGPAELNPSKLSNAQISELGAEALWDSPHPSASSLLWFPQLQNEMLLLARGEGGVNSAEIVVKML